MKYFIICLTIIVLFFIGCENGVEFNNFPSIKGTYSGYYIFNSDNVIDTGIVEIVFNDTSYQCNPIQSRYILPGSGVYNIRKDTLDIKDLLVRAAIFDLRLVVNGNFLYSFQNKKLILFQKDKRTGITKRFELIKSN